MSSSRALLSALALVSVAFLTGCLEEADTAAADMPAADVPGGGTVI